MKKKNFIVPLVVYPFDIYVSIGETDGDFKNGIKRVMTKEMFKELCEDPVACNLAQYAKGRTLVLTSNQTIIRVKNTPEYPEDYGVLQHEIFHAVTFIMDRVGMKFKLLCSDESYSYLIQHVTTEIYKRL